MMTVAQSTAVPLIPAPRGRFGALAVGADAAHLSAVMPRLRSLGASAVHSAATAGAGRIPHPVGPHDICVIDAPLASLPDELRSVRANGWRRIVVVGSRSESVRLAIAGGARSCVVPTPRGAHMSVAPPRPSRAQQGSPDALSEREIQVLQGVAEGQTNRGIGEELSLSALTVKSHLARIARKLGTGDRAEMVAIGMRTGILA
jgi:DNA-binding CsgD family transcriptional regulator